MPDEKVAEDEPKLWKLATLFNLIGSGHSATPTLLYFILSSIRGLIRSAKVVQGIISELESQGALPRSNLRVSSLVMSCGPMFGSLILLLQLFLCLHFVYSDILLTERKRGKGDPVEMSASSVAYQKLLTKIFEMN